MDQSIVIAPCLLFILTKFDGERSGEGILMKKIIAGMIVMFVLAAAGVSSAEKNKAYYVCACTDGCKCSSISREPGKCACGREMTAMHVLEIEKKNAVLCSCGADCACERSKKDPNLCGCGKSVKKMDLTGKYACACGYKSCVCSGSCTCGSISDKPGKCECGKEMKKI